MGRLVLHVCRAMRGRHAPRAIVTARDETPTAPSEELEPATGRPCVPALRNTSQQREDAITLMAPFWGLPGAFDQLGVLGRKRIQFYGNWRLSAEVEHSRLRATDLFSSTARPCRHTHTRCGSCVAECFSMIHVVNTTQNTCRPPTDGVMNSRWRLDF